MTRTTAHHSLSIASCLLALAASGFCSGCHDGGAKGSPSTMPSASGGGNGAGGNAAGGGGTGTGGDSTVVVTKPTPGLMGPPNCGLPSAAFCDGFDAPAKTRGRGGDLNPATWSAARLSPLGPTDKGQAFPIGASKMGPCRTGSAELAFPPDDTLICDPTPDIQNSHLLVGVAAQNYGLNSYRVRQPFDFAGRTGKIVFDAQGYSTLGWVSLEVTDEPIPAPSFALYVNDEGGVIPKNGVEMQFSQTCGQGGVPTVFGLNTFHEFNNYADTVQKRQSFDCPTAKKGALNHFEITISQTKVEIAVSPVSADGVNFEPTKMMFSTAVSLPFTRGYVHLAVHNHATLKYSTAEWAGNAGETGLDAWLAELDNVGFDGPILMDTREYEAPDAMTAATAPWPDPQNPTNKAVNIGYILPDVAAGASTPLTFSGVDLDKVKSAQLALNSWYPDDGHVADLVLKYRFNGGAWRDRKVTAAEAALFQMPVVKGGDGTPKILNGLGQTVDVDPADLVAGDNTLEFATEHAPGGYPPGVANIDLILHTE